MQRTLSSQFSISVQRTLSSQFSISIPRTLSSPHSRNPIGIPPIANFEIAQNFSKFFSENALWQLIYHLAECIRGEIMAATKQPRKKRGNSVVTEKQDKYIEARLDGKNKLQAATEAGYNVNGVALIEKSEDVRAALAEARSELSSATQMKRADVIEMLKEAYDMAKLAAEPSSMVSAAKEIGKMIGCYEPETIRIETTRSASNVQRKLMTMSDEELADIANGSATVVDGEFQRLS